MRREGAIGGEGGRRGGERGREGVPNEGIWGGPNKASPILSRA